MRLLLPELALLWSLVQLWARAADEKAHGDAPAPAACEFETVTAAQWQRDPAPPERWAVPVLVTGARQAGKGWSSPFNMLEDLIGRRYDHTQIAVGPGASTALFGGGAARRSTLAAFRANMTSADVVFDTQNSGAGRHVELPIPGVPFGGKQSGWWNVVSIGAAGAGLPLHEHGAASPFRKRMLTFYFLEEKFRTIPITAFHTIKALIVN